VSLAVQHPGHDVPAHEQPPPEQVSPVRQALQAAPAVPHSVPDWAENGTHAPMELQQPLGHEVASQTHFPALVSHSSSEGHAAQAPPPAPHCAAVCEVCGTHWPLASQHPSAQVLGLQDAPVSGIVVE
jgi:hypothetical protein